MNCKLVLNNIRYEFKEYVVNAKLKSVVLGVSGGIDSAIVAAIVKPICDEIKIELIGVSLPSDSNKDCEVERADGILFEFCSETLTYNIDSPVKSFKKALHFTEPKTKEEKIAMGNIKARCRMIILYDIAYTNSGMVLGTDNLTEYNLGFFTIFGDQADFSSIQYLWKTEVYELAQYIADTELKDNYEARKALISCINATPTDGLGVTNSDLDQIGVKTYAEVDMIFKEYFEMEGGKEKHGDNPVIQRHIKTAYKRKHPYCISRETLFKENSI